MKIKLSKRLQINADMVPHGARVADIGCDHGYLGIYLLQNELAEFVVASDLNKMPLESAKENAAQYGVADKIAFVCANGLDGIDPEAVDAIVIGGIGGDLMRGILERAPWVRNPKYTLILQPQSGAKDFRQWLFTEGFSVLQEEPSVEENHIYFTMQLRYTGERFFATPGQLYVTPQMLQSKSEDLPLYMDHVLRSLRRSIEGLEKSANPGEKLDFFLAAEKEILEMRDKRGESA